MQDATKAQEVFTQATGKGLEAMTFWAEANQRVLRELVDFSAGTAKESIRLYAELQQAAIDALLEAKVKAPRSTYVRELLGLAFYHLGRWKEAARELAAFRRMMSELNASRSALEEATRQLRAREARHLGFTRCVMPENSLTTADTPSGLAIVGVRTVGEALDALL